MESKQKSKEKSRLYRERNREKYQAYNKLYVVKMAEHRRNYNLKLKFGITIKDYDELLVLQDNKCAICLTDASQFKKRLAVDHCHKTNVVRGLLCSDCNRGIGLLKDSAELVARAANYLERKND